MATTTNYGWTTPDDTDLVKDGAAAIRTLGSSIDTSFVADQGDLLLGGASDIFEPLAIGAATTVLTSDGTTASWVAPAGGGKVLQVVMGTHSTETANSTNTFADTNLSATITPSSATSKVLIMCSTSTYKSTANSQSGVIINLVRDATQIVADFAGIAGFTAVAEQNRTGSASITYLDEPNTTSAITYKARFKNFVNAASVVVQSQDSTGTIVLMEIGA